MQRMGRCLGPIVLITMVSPSSGWGGPLECPVLRELVLVLLSKRPADEGGGSVQMLMGSCADNWSVQLLDESLVRVTRVSSCSRTLVRINNQLPKTRGAGAWDFRVEDQGGVLQCPSENLCRQLYPVPSTQDFGVDAGWARVCGQLERPVA